MPRQVAPQISLPAAFALLLTCQLAGEILVTLLRQVAPSITFPGPVIGMAIYLAILFARGGPGESEAAATDGLLKNLSLLFVPAAVGIVQHGEILRSAGLALAVAILLSTLVTLLVTVFVFLGVQKLTGSGDDA